MFNLKCAQTDFCRSQALFPASSLKEPAVFLTFPDVFLCPAPRSFVAHSVDITGEIVVFTIQIKFPDKSPIV